MKKGILLFLSVTAVFMFSQCGKTNKYVIEGHIDTGGKPAIAYLSYLVENAERVDSVVVKNNSFSFRGKMLEPFRAVIGIDYGSPSYMAQEDQRQLYIEPGKMTITSRDSIINSVITGSPINEDGQRWQEISMPFISEQNALTAEFHRYRMSGDASPEGLDSLEREYAHIGERYTNRAIDFIKESPDSYFALMELYPIIMDRSLDPVKGQELLDMFSDKVKKTGLGQRTQARIDGWNNTTVGHEAPDFTQNDPDGKPVSLSDFRGKYVLLDFWASWCAPCRKENPYIVKAYDLYKDKGFTILGVSLDGRTGDTEKERGKWLGAIKEDGLAWTHVSQLNGWGNDLVLTYGIMSIPANFLIDPNGIVVGKDIKGSDLPSILDNYLNL